MFVEVTELDSFDADLKEFSGKEWRLYIIDGSNNGVLVDNRKLITEVRDFVTVIFIDWDAIVSVIIKDSFNVIVWSVLCRFVILNICLVEEALHSRKDRFLNWDFYFNEVGKREVLRLGE